jgi:uncharacterized protein (TIGR03437 family)
LTIIGSSGNLWIHARCVNGHPPRIRLTIEFSLLRLPRFLEEFMPKQSFLMRHVWMMFVLALGFCFLPAIGNRIAHSQDVSDGGARLQALCSNPSFAPQPPIAAGGRPRPIVAADFNGDGKLDLATGNARSLFSGVTFHNVSVLLGDGLGGFQPGPGSPTGVSGAPISIASADFNNDGKVDLAVAAESTSEILILLGDGAGGLQARSTISYPTRPTYIAAEDLNGDGKQDLAITLTDEHKLDLQLGDGTGRFTTAAGSPIPVGQRPFFVAVGKFNGDARPDLAVANLDSKSVTILLNQPNQTFSVAPGSPLTVPESAYAVVARDFNGDDKIDVAVKNAPLDTGVGYISVFLGDGGGRFAPAPSRGTVPQPAPVGFFGYLVAGDFDQDNRMDLIDANWNGSDVSVWYGDGSGGFRARQKIDVYRSPYAIAVGDFDGGGRLDFAVSFEGEEKLLPFLTGCTINTPPGIGVTAMLTREQGVAGTVSTVATVADAQSPLGELLVTAVNLPAGVAVTNITNVNGTISARVAAGCSAAVGPNTVELIVADAGNLSASANLTVNVIANTPPTLSYPGQQTTDVGGELTVNPANGPVDQGNVASIAVRNVTPSFSGKIAVNRLGVVSVAEAGPFGNYSVTIRATDNCGGTTDATFTLNVGCPAVTINPPALPAGLTGAPYSQTLSQTGGGGAVSYSIVAGETPPGLALSSSGTFAGTPTKSGSYTFQVKAAIENGCAGTREYTVAINCSGVTLGPASLPRGNVGNPYEQTFISTGGAGAYRYVLRAGDLPPGLLLSSDGVLSGVPLLAGEYPLTIAVIDASGCGVESTYPLVIGPQLAGCVSSASYLGGTLTQDMIATAFGANLATISTPASAIPLPTELGGTRILVKDAGGVERAAQIFYISPNQINFLIPHGMSEGPATAVITSGDQTVSVCEPIIQPVMPGIFTANSSGSGVAAGIVLRVNGAGEQTFESVFQFDPVAGGLVPLPIDLGPETDQVYLLLFGTGIRDRSSLAAALATIGGEEAPVVYAGQQGDLSGLDQLNILLPRSLLARGLVDVILTVDGRPANTVQISLK